MIKKSDVLIKVHNKDRELFEQNPDEFWKDIKKISREAFLGIDWIKHLEIPEGIILIGEQAFYNCDMFSVKIPSTVKEVGRGAFMWCKHLNKVNFEGEVKNLFETFAYCESIKVVNFPKTLEKIGKRSFLGCVSLEKIEIPEKVQEISTSAFEGCVRLKDITFNNELQKIGKSAFYKCSSLEKVEFPVSLKSLGDCSFVCCKKLKEVYLPNKNTTYDNAFDRNSNIKIHFTKNYTLDDESELK